MLSAGFAWQNLNWIAAKQRSPQAAALFIRTPAHCGRLPFYNTMRGLRGAAGSEWQGFGSR